MGMTAFADIQGLLDKPYLFQRLAREHRDIFDTAYELYERPFRRRSRHEEEHDLQWLWHYLEKLAHLEATGAQAIVSANIGCITHLQGGTETPVLHWIELIAGALASAGPRFGLFPGEAQRAGRVKRGRGPKPLPDPQRPL